MAPSWTHLLHQAFWYEGLALLLILPIVERAMGPVATAFWLLVCLSIVVCCWTPMFNAVFDKYIPASSQEKKRHWQIRTFHALLFEVTVVSLTTPIVVWWTDMNIEKAIYLNAQISLFYIVYAYVFFLLWDTAQIRLRRQKSQKHWTPESHQ
jgi:uncharacterized membrane protein